MISGAPKESVQSTQEDSGIDLSDQANGRAAYKMVFEALRRSLPPGYDEKTVMSFLS